MGHYSPERIPEDKEATTRCHARRERIPLAINRSIDYSINI
uniref:Uncharacterized protein n=1 Tax=Heterorhabditis bacteriophora TaxID=37862 RepID=A0A1I7XEZ3_HETBA